ncbi:spermidine/putrescine transport system substrate-binding protein [Hathewaya proteolytica DSM 3090]|uniref:Spermidine/putrescine transport system substrate-binding protein n=1 Tax=Hathewaya proteolytica DSM 3090 TaxID=1121331 RepID=A0A1M6J2G6_9CLOT|nr:spermidine/putrescine ABC transporter substrate-binding protein [Hathewaya proteolytica]SHJ40869.1 spermidine/putrescine transport system substrate-binding protein [Hathewaya proteolytica DSM 3090]
MRKRVLFVLMIIISSMFFVSCNHRENTLNIYNWGDYIDMNLLDEFSKKYNVKVSYNEFGTNEEMYVKLKHSRGQCDVTVPSDYMISKLINESMLEPLNYDNIPNFKEIDDSFKDLDFDKKNIYSVPYMWGTVGIIYNKSLIKDEINSWDDLWNEKYAGEILMMDSQRDSMAVALKKLGYSINSVDEKELMEAGKLLIAQKPLVLAYTGDEVKDLMIGGEAAMAVVYSGDAMVMIEENQDLCYVVPKEGTNLWFDNLVIPKDAKNKELAEKFINFIIGREAAKRNCEYIGYSTPNKYTKEMLDEDTRNNPIAYPEQSVIDKAQVFVDLKENIKLYDRIWTDVKIHK